jgi:hypothetical protein
LRVSIEHPNLRVFLGVTADHQVPSILGHSQINVVSLVTINENSRLFSCRQYKLFNLVGAIHSIGFHIEDHVSPSSKLHLTDPLELQVGKDLILCHVFDASSEPLCVSNVQGESYETMIIVHYGLIHKCLPYEFLTHEGHLFKIENGLSLGLGLLGRFEIRLIRMSAVDLIHTWLVVFSLLMSCLVSVLFVSEEVDIVAILFGDGLNLGVRAAEDMLPPLFIMKSAKLDPVLKILILPLDDPLLPFLVVADVIIRVETIVAVKLCLLIPLCMIVSSGLKRLFSQ